MMNHGCNQIFTGAALASEQHRKICIGNAVYLFHHFDERLADRDWELCIS
jgi:hypothetical protein